MVARWRRPFCTSIRRDPETAPAAEKRSFSPRICAKFGGLFSGGGGGSSPSTPRLKANSTPSIIHCRTNAGSPKKSAATNPLPSSRSERRSPRRLFQASSEPPSPRSPSRFAFFKASLRFSRNKCGVCALSVRTADGAAVFTAECSHSFHLACIAPHAAARTTLVICPVCSATWRHSPLISSVSSQPPPSSAAGTDAADEGRKSQRQWKTDKDSKIRGSGGEPKPTAAAKFYDDDEPLLLSSTVRFNPIPEADEVDSREDIGASPLSLYPSPTEAAEVRHTDSGVEVSVMPEAALVSAGRSHRNYVIALKVKAPPPTVAAPLPLLDPSRRAPIDLVTVLDVSGSAELHMLKRGLRQLIFSLGPEDRLSIVAFSSNAAKRLLPLHRMSRQGQRSARHIVDRLIVSRTHGHGGGGGAGDALKKAIKVLEDRRERNPVATIMLLSDGPELPPQQQSNADDIDKDCRRTTTVDHRTTQLEVPIHGSGLGDSSTLQKPVCLTQEENPFSRYVLGGLLSTVFRDVRLQFVFSAGEISAIYSCGGSRRAVTVGGGGSARLGDLHVGEVQDLLVEVRVPVDAGVAHHHAISVEYSYRDAATMKLTRGREKPLLMPPLPGCSDQHGHTPLLRSSSLNPNAHRLRNLFVATRAMVESRRLAEFGDTATAVHLLSSARSLLLQSASVSSNEDLILSLEADLTQLQRLQLHSPCGRNRGNALPTSSAIVDDRGEALTPTSAWRAAERLAKVAIMRKSLNRVSDLHGFENARF